MEKITSPRKELIIENKKPENQTGNFSNLKVVTVPKTEGSPINKENWETYVGNNPFFEMIALPTVKSNKIEDLREEDPNENLKLDNCYEWSGLFTMEDEKENVEETDTDSTVATFTDEDDAYVTIDEEIDSYSDIEGSGEGNIDKQ